MLGIIIQARMGSNRLPGKVLKMIGNKTLLEHIFFRVARLENTAKVVVATSKEELDDQIEELCKKNQIACFRGSELNVLERYYLCATQYGFDDIVRLTADNPFVDIEELDRLIYFFRSEKAEYAHSFHVLPDGAGAEIFTYKALEKCFQESSMPHHFEHVNEYMLENPDKFKTVVLSVKAGKNKPDIRLTVDRQEDYERACYIVENSTEKYITTQEAIKLALKYIEKRGGVYEKTK